MTLRITINLDTIIARVQARREHERSLRAVGVAILRDWKKRMTSPIDQSRLFAGAKQDPPRVPKAGELFFEVMRGHTRIRCELRDHGPFGVEAQILHNEELVIGRTFHQRIDPTRTPRAMAIAWAEEERKALERDGATS